MKSRQNTDRDACYLIIGAGNILLSDEGIGIHLLNELRKEEAFKKTKYVDIGTSSLDISMHLDAYVKKIVIIDCIKADDFRPGTVFKMSVEDLRKRQSENFSLHQLELVDSLKLIDLTDKLPETLVIGIVPKNIGTYSLGLSSDLRKKFSRILDKIKNEINVFLSNNA